jgi:hypothetical protein
MGRFSLVGERDRNNGFLVDELNSRAWAQLYPQYAVSRWIGHSIMVSGRHYANAIPDELFERAAGEQATRNPTLHAAEPARTGSQSAA